MTEMERQARRRRATLKAYRRSWRYAIAGLLALSGALTVVCCSLLGALAVKAEDKPVAAPAEEIEQPVAVECIAKEPAFTEAELETLALIIYQEAGADYCSDETRAMVGTVVLNRVADSRFPDTIDEVALQRAQYGRLYWTGLEWPERADQEVEAHAVQRAYDCAEELLNGERALPEDVVYQAEFIQGTEVVAHQDGFYFCR